MIFLFFLPENSRNHSMPLLFTLNCRGQGEFVNFRETA